MTESSKDTTPEENLLNTVNAVLEQRRKTLGTEVCRLRLVYERLEVDISELEQQKRTLAVTIEQMSYNKRSWWQRLLGI